MELEEKIKAKKQILQQKVEQYQKHKQAMDNLTNQILKLQGAVEQLKELEEEDDG